MIILDISKEDLDTISESVRGNNNREKPMTITLNEEFSIGDSAFSENNQGTLRVSINGSLYEYAEHKAFINRIVENIHKSVELINGYSATVEDEEKNDAINYLVSYPAICENHFESIRITHTFNTFDELLPFLAKV